MTQSYATKLFIAAKSDFSVEGMLRLFSDSGEINIVACVEPSEECWDKLRRTHPDVLLLHHSAVQSPIREFFARIAATAPGVRIIIFGLAMPDDFLLQVVRAGAAGYINQNMNSRNLLQAVLAVRDGGLWVERDILEILARDGIDIDATLENTILEKIDAVRKILTKQETVVFKLVLDGLATKEIAARMHLSEQSIKLYLGQIFRKFQVANRTQLILQVFARICPASNIYRLIKMAMDKRRIDHGQPPLIEDSLPRG